jgi:hypothetical protein
MATLTDPVVVPRVASEVQRVLSEHRPQLCEKFAAEFHAATAETDIDFDTSRIDRLVGRWWAHACVLLNPDPEADAARERLRAGDTSDLVEWWCPQDDGSQGVYRRTGDGSWAFDHVIPAP